MLLDDTEDISPVDSQAFVMVNAEVENLLSKRQSMLACFVRTVRLTNLFSSSSSHPLDTPLGAKKGQFGQSNSIVCVDWLINDSICPFASSTTFAISRGTRNADARKARVPATSADEICMFESVAEY
jgi:hypothetical protein